jgi:chemotaxis protein methyltransferase CheR
MKNSFESISKVLMQVYQVDLSKFNVSFLSTLIKNRLNETGFHSEEEYSAFLAQNEQEEKKFFESLYICFSEFFRNTLTYSVLEQIILPSIILQNKNTKRKEIRIWSAACAGGQEAFSLAMILEEMNNGTNRKLNYRIFASDSSEKQLSEAKNGKYFVSNLGTISLKRAQRWFNPEGEYYSIKPELKTNIDFSVFDLLDQNLSSPPASIYGDFDLVICSNILFYYNEPCRKNILQKISQSLTPGGYLITGEAERDILMSNNFIEVFPQSAIFKRRKERIQ